MTGTATKIKPTMGKKAKSLSAADRRTFKGRFAIRLAELMDARGLSATSLAALIDVDEPAIRKWLRADGLPELKQIEPLGKALGLKDYREVLPV